MGRLVSLAALAMSAVATTVAGFMFYSDFWVETETADMTIQTEVRAEGLFRECIFSATTHRTCDYYDEWVFSSTFPSWILAGRILVFLSIVTGFFATIGLLLGSDISTMYESDVSKKKWLKRASSIGIILAASLLLIQALWTFIKVFRNYNDVNDLIMTNQPVGINQKFIPGSATYISLVVSVVWLVFGLLALFGTKNSARRG